MRCVPSLERCFRRSEGVYRGPARVTSRRRVSLQHMGPDRGNEFVDTVTKSLEQLFLNDPPRFHARVPHGYSEPATIERDLLSAGFGAPEITTVAEHSKGRSAREVAMAYCQGTPLRNEIEERDASLLGDATVVATKAPEQNDLEKSAGREDKGARRQGDEVKTRRQIFELRPGAIAANLSARAARACSPSSRGARARCSVRKSGMSPRRSLSALRP